MLNNFTGILAEPFSFGNNSVKVDPSAINFFVYLENVLGFFQEKLGKFFFRYSS